MWGVPQILWRFSILKNTHEEACTSRRGGAAVHLWSLQQKFPTVGKLNQHSEKHQDIRCEYCNKSFAYICTMKAHAAESCSERPGQSSEDPAKASTSKKSAPEGPRWRCHKCSSHFGARRNLKKHLNGKHDSVDILIGYKPL